MGQKVSHIGACGASTVRDMGSAIAARPGSVLGSIHSVKDVLTDFDLGFAAGTDFGVRLAKAAQEGGFPDDTGDYRSMAQMLIRIFDDSGNGKLEADEVYNMVQSIAQVRFQHVMTRSCNRLVDSSTRVALDVLPMSAPNFALCCRSFSPSPTAATWLEGQQLQVQVQRPLLVAAGWLITRRRSVR